jgi:acyl dehydratase
MKYFEDIIIGTRIELGSYTFDAESIKAFARKYDPQAFHVDEEAAKKSHFGKLVASGWHTAAISMRLTVDGTRRANENQKGDIIKSGPSPGVRDLKWHKPVFAGDTVSYATEIIELREMSRPGWGLMVTKSTGTNQNGELVYSVQGAVLVARKPT